MKALLAALAAAIIGVSCGGRQTPTLPAPASDPGVSLPAAVAIADGLRVTLRRPLQPGERRSIEKLRDVVVTASVTVATTRVVDSPRAVRLRVAAADPIAFRSFAPAPTRDADFVWTSLAAGQAVLTPDARRRLDFKAPGSIRIGRRPVQVGAFADNSAPNLGDVLVARAPGGRGPEKHLLLVGLRDSDSLDRAKEAIRTRVDGVVKIKRLAPQPATAVAAPAADPVGRAEGDLIGEMTFRILKSGYIEPDPAWVEANIATGTVPILGRVTCHRLVFPQLAAALAEIEQEGLARRIRPSDFGGCYVPRFIGRDPRRGLSMHAFGLALDLNVSTNYLGTRGDMDPRVVAIFEKWGFGWGGRWSTPDPMHFELARLIRT